MAPRLIHWVADLFADSGSEPDVHFHAGPHSEPAACFDARCDAPQLEVSPTR